MGYRGQWEWVGMGRQVRVQDREKSASVLSAWAWQVVEQWWQKKRAASLSLPALLCSVVDDSNEPHQAVEEQQQGGAQLEEALHLPEACG